MHIVGSVSEIQRSDIWSFGCVLSLAATWLVKGFHGIQLFDRYRQSALHEGERNDYGCFHDGNKVLVEVLQWHAFTASHPAYGPDYRPITEPYRPATASERSEPTS
jgi:hypothetical protein